MCKHRRLRLACAAILGERRSMPREHTYRLQEAPGRPAPDACVIDAQFTEVGVKKRGWLGRVWAGVVTVFWVAVAGFMIPPVIVIVREISNYLAGR
jgi:hypothetical protein